MTVCQYCKTLPQAYNLGLGSGFSVCQINCLFCSASNSWLHSDFPLPIFHIAIPGPLPVDQIRFFYAVVVLLLADSFPPATTPPRRPNLYWVAFGTSLSDFALPAPVLLVDGLFPTCHSAYFFSLAASRPDCPAMPPIPLLGHVRSSISGFALPAHGTSRHVCAIISVCHQLLPLTDIISIYTYTFWPHMRSVKCRFFLSNIRNSIEI